MSDVLLIGISALLSLLVSLVTSWVTSRHARKRWQKERISSTRDEAYREVARAAYRFARTLREVSDDELAGRPYNTDLVTEAHSHLNDAMFMLHTVAEERSAERISNAYDLAATRALEVDPSDPAIQTTGTEAVRIAQQALNRFVETVSMEMRAHIENRQ